MAGNGKVLNGSPEITALDTIPGETQPQAPKIDKQVQTTIDLMKRRIDQDTNQVLANLEAQKAASLATIDSYRIDMLAKIKHAFQATRDELKMAEMQCLEDTQKDLQAELRMMLGE